MRHLHFTVNKLLGRVANPRPVATIKTGRVAQPITDAFWCDLVNPSDREKTLPLQAYNTPYTVTVWLVGSPS